MAWERNSADACRMESVENRLNAKPQKGRSRGSGAAFLLSICLSNRLRHPLGSFSRPAIRPIVSGPPVRFAFTSHRLGSVGAPRFHVPSSPVRRCASLSRPIVSGLSAASPSVQSSPARRCAAFRSIVSGLPVAPPSVNRLRPVGAPRFPLIVFGPSVRLAFTSNRLRSAGAPRFHVQSSPVCRSPAFRSIVSCLSAASPSVQSSPSRRCAAIRPIVSGPPAAPFSASPSPGRLLWRKSCESAGILVRIDD